MNKGKDSNFDIVCSLLLLYSGLFFEDAFPILIIGIGLSIYGLFRSFKRREA
ncbi:hypothetical protein [Clostridium intestinale]|uniref:Uncharacterized protein n=1 Tax=Clostridium intestinale TaxID=36845 RepID=A0A7D7A6T8_9CLOT|nr:hypothetical protein [Clostridium intestinale]QLY82158.1 hypothetical protein HZF06_11385 [Clostridium intestinale]